MKSITGDWLMSFFNKSFKFSAGADVANAGSSFAGLMSPLTTGTEAPSIIWALAF